VSSALALFDLDNTLIAGDSDHLWGEHLAEVGAVPPEEQRRVNERFLRDYRAGTLDMAAFLSFQLAPLARFPRPRLEAWRSEFIEERIRPLVLPKAMALIEKHRAAGRRLAIVTATNAFITRPIASLFGIDDLLATIPEEIEGEYTGRPSGILCYAQGKAARVRDWANREALSLSGAWFYSDSHTDLPLLEAVDHPVAVDPDPRLREQAIRAGWPILSLR
jgi:HAD superfamily hydrolase (TIGR01490 family)